MRSGLSRLFALALLFLAVPALAQGTAEKVEKDNRFAMELFDLGEYKSAQQKLDVNLKTLKSQGLGGQEITARTHVLLGLVYARGFNKDAEALKHFVAALKIQKDAQLPAGRGDELATELFEKARQEVYPVVNCESLMGVAHNQIEFAREGEAARIEAKVDSALQKSSTLLVFYRGPQAPEYVEVPMEKGADCTYAAEIPAEQISAPKIEYYLEAQSKDGRAVARRGKADEPFVVNVSFGAAPAPAQASDEESIDEEPAPPREDLPEELGGQPQKPRGSSCAGCQGSGGATGAAALLVLLAVAPLARRRRQ